MTRLNCTCNGKRLNQRSWLVQLIKEILEIISLSVEDAQFFQRYKFKLSRKSNN